MTNPTHAPLISEGVVPKCRIKPAGTCVGCGNEKSYTDCWNCGGEGYSDHDCGEDCCCCLHPEDNVVCDICEGDGGFYVCARCHPESFDE